jgi:hypothetical protein
VPREMCYVSRKTDAQFWMLNVLQLLPRKFTFLWWVVLAAEGQGKFHARTVHKGPEGKQTYSSTPSLTSILGGGGCLTPFPGSFTPEKENRCSLYCTGCWMGQRTGQNE